MSLISRLKGLFWDDGAGAAASAEDDQEPLPEQLPPLEIAVAPPADTPAAPAVPPEEHELRRLVEGLRSTGSEAPVVDTRRVEELISYLVEDGWNRTAIDLLRELVALAPRLGGLRLRLAELLFDLKELPEARELLEYLLDDPEHRARAHFLLGEYHVLEGDAPAALRHYESVLALDFTYPRARGRADELRRRLDRPLATAAPTIFGAEDLGPGGRFLLQRELGRGGGGTVYLAVDHQLGRPVAVKVLHPHVAQRQEARVHLFCEARIAAALRHPRIVTIYDLEEALNLVVMEFCAGGALSSRILASGPLPPVAALERLAEITTVLDTVHRCGVIHRDLKPANLLLRTDGEAAPLVLTDFGTAHAAGADEGGEQAAAGSLIYMAPEQRRGAAVDPRADIYACGVILLEMLLGRPPLGPQQAIAGAALLELDELWRELEQALPRGAGRDLSRFCRALVAPTVDPRPPDAEQVTRAALDLARRLRESELRGTVMEDLRRRAGESPAARSWLASHERELGS